MGSDSICLAYGVLDRVFSVLRVRRRLLKVLGAASLSLAIKYIEDENNQSYARFLCDVSFKRRLFLSGADFVNRTPLSRVVNLWAGPDCTARPS